MQRSLSALVLGSLLAASAFSQSNAKFPPEVLSAKTVAILNDTRSSEVEDGATQELKEWGHLRVTEDVQNADIVLHFSKKSTRDGQSTSKTDDNGKPDSWSYGMTFGSKISMDATAKDGVAPFYSTTTDDSKKKAGLNCVQVFIGKYQEAVRSARSTQ